jgi:hypothetical protein
MCWRVVEAAEDALHGLHALYMRARLMVAATLALGQSESPPGEHRSANARVQHGDARHKSVTLVDYFASRSNSDNS